LKKSHASGIINLYILCLGELVYLRTAVFIYVYLYIYPI